MRKTYWSLLLVTLLALGLVLSICSNAFAHTKAAKTKSKTTISLIVKPQPSPNPTDVWPTLKIGLKNIGKKPIWVENRIILGHHVDIYAKSIDGNLTRLHYPAFSIVKASKTDFTKLMPSTEVSRIMPLAQWMPPKLFGKTNKLTLVVSFSERNDGHEFGINAWTGVLKKEITITRKAGT